MNSCPPPWYQILDVEEVPSPALLVYIARVEENIRRMIALAGGVARLRPHIKTHKLAELIRLQQAHGITKFKCATIAEAELAADCGVADLLLAYQPVGPNVERLVQLAQKFPRTKFSAIVDDAGAIRALAAAFARAGLVIDVLLDLDCGQHRTGVVPDANAVELYRLIANSPGLRAAGLQAYDGHIHDHDPVARAVACDNAFAPVELLRDDLTRAGLPVPTIVAGGTPTFPMHARRTDVECSPGTCVFWDAGYTTKLPDLDFLPAALVLTRVISKPGSNRLCLDLGHKAIAAENPHPRVQFPELPDAKAISHSEEHLVIETAQAANYAVGDALYGIPWHICPTVALHSEAVVVKDGRAGERWCIDARARRLTI
ncbi:MAG: D-TA family PLP-dependent enzyme [Verrucomicrobia bacterium]|nr:D-TA family PLP-dependent enzyme [Verrucomicrobiota bacterium]